jgi:DNA-binding NtrC family response regulator
MASLQSLTDIQLKREWLSRHSRGGIMPLKDRMEAIIVEMVEKGILLDLAQRDFEKKYLKIALDINQGSRLATARALGIHRNTLNNKLAKHRLRSRRNGS